MLNNAAVAPVLPSTDLDRSKDFYQNKLGLKLVEAPMDDPLIFQAGSGSTLVVYYRKEGNKAEHTQAGFNVDDVEASVKELEAKGVKFEDYDQENLKTVDHIMDYDGSKAAWFKDPDGNILSLNEM